MGEIGELSDLVHRPIIGAPAACIRFPIWDRKSRPNFALFDAM